MRRSQTFYSNLLTSAKLSQLGTYSSKTQLNYSGQSHSVPKSIRLMIFDAGFNAASSHLTLAALKYNLLVSHVVEGAQLSSSCSKLLLLNCTIFVRDESAY